MFFLDQRFYTCFYAFTFTFTNIYHSACAVGGTQGVLCVPTSLSEKNLENFILRFKWLKK